MPSKRQESAKARNDRLRDNKRSYRSRKKEYVSDLERRLDEVRQEGIRATKEVQLSAQEVVRQNARLRELLRHLGVEDDMVEKWVRGNICHLQAAEFPRPAQAVVPAAVVSAAVVPAAGERQGDGTQQAPEHGHEVTESEPHRGPRKGEPTQEQPYPQPLKTGKCGKDKTCGSRATRELPEENMSSAVLPTPCKLLTHLALNPSADVTQMPVKADSEAERSDVDGVECSKAYRMLMQYATSEGKLDTISRVLEEGCVINEGSGGGCRVRNKAIWRALDEICD